jgi:hypothetical protein
MTLSDRFIVPGVLALWNMTIFRQSDEPLLHWSINVDVQRRNFANLTFRVSTLRRGDRRRIPDNVLKRS